MKALLALMVLVSMNVFAGERLADLKAGDVLSGVDKISGEDCSLEITNNSPWVGLTTVFTLGSSTYKSELLGRKLSIASELYFKELLRVKEGSNLRVVEGLFRKSKLGGGESYMIREFNFYDNGSYYQSKKVVDCQFDTRN